MTKRELTTKLAALGPLTDEQRNSVTCSLIGHSKIQTFCFGYYSCGRCGEQLGDSLGGIYTEAANVVIAGHDCEICQANYKNTTWRDRLFVANPFTTEDLK